MTCRIFAVLVVLVSLLPCCCSVRERSAHAASGFEGGNADKEGGLEPAGNLGGGDNPLFPGALPPGSALPPDIPNPDSNPSQTQLHKGESSPTDAAPMPLALYRTKDTGHTASVFATSRGRAAVLLRDGSHSDFRFFEFSPANESSTHQSGVMSTDLPSGAVQLAAVGVEGAVIVVTEEKGESVADVGRHIVRAVDVQKGGLLWGVDLKEVRNVSSVRVASVSQTHVAVVSSTTEYGVTIFDDPPLMQTVEVHVVDTVLRTSQHRIADRPSDDNVNHAFLPLGMTPSGLLFLHAEGRQKDPLHTMSQEGRHLNVVPSAVLHGTIWQTGSCWFEGRAVLLTVHSKAAATFRLVMQRCGEGDGEAVDSPVQCEEQATVVEVSSPIEDVVCTASGRILVVSWVLWDTHPAGSANLMQRRLYSFNEDGVFEHVTLPSDVGRCGDGVAGVPPQVALSAAQVGKFEDTVTLCTFSTAHIAGGSSVTVYAVVAEVFHSAYKSSNVHTELPELWVKRDTSTTAAVTLQPFYSAFTVIQMGDTYAFASLAADGVISFSQRNEAHSYLRNAVYSATSADSIYSAYSPKVATLALLTGAKITLINLASGGELSLLLPGLRGSRLGSPRLTPLGIFTGGPGDGVHFTACYNAIPTEAEYDFQIMHCIDFNTEGQVETHLQIDEQLTPDIIAAEVIYAGSFLTVVARWWWWGGEVQILNILNRELHGALPLQVGSPGGEHAVCVLGIGVDMVTKIVDTDLVILEQHFAERAWVLSMRQCAMNYSDVASNRFTCRDAVIITRDPVPQTRLSCTGSLGNVTLSWISWTTYPMSGKEHKQELRHQQWKLPQPGIRSALRPAGDPYAAMALTHMPPHTAARRSLQSLHSAGKETLFYSCPEGICRQAALPPDGTRLPHTDTRCFAEVDTARAEVEEEGSSSEEPGFLLGLCVGGGGVLVMGVCAILVYWVLQRIAGSRNSTTGENVPQKDSVPNPLPPQVAMGVRGTSEPDVDEDDDNDDSSVGLPFEGDCTDDMSEVHIEMNQQALGDDASSGSR